MGYFSLQVPAATIAVFILFFAALAAALAPAEKQNNLKFYANLALSAIFAVGAALASNFLTMLFFWEGLLIMLYLFLLPYNKETALKAFLINAAGDVVLLLGIALYGAAAGTLDFVSLSPLKGQSFWAFILIFTGCVAKAGAFPFHSWIAPAAKDASFSFMALLPAAVEKLLAVFLMGKIFTVIFPLLPGCARAFVCLIGIITIAIAGARMLVFKDLRQLLAWNIIMQIGLLALAMGARTVFTESDDFYILNHGIFKAALLACAFYGAAYYNAAFGGVTLANLRGAAKACPGVFGVLVLCALGLAGVTVADILFVPNALLADSWESFAPLALVPVAASLITLMCFGKVFAAMLGKGSKKPKKAILPRVITLIAALPVIFFTFGFELSSTHFFAPHFAGFNFGFPAAACLVILAGGALLALKVSLPKYDIKKDTFDYAKTAIYFGADILFFVDRVMDKLTDYLPSMLAEESSKAISGAHRGNTPQYIIWAVVGVLVFMAALIGGLN